MVSVSPAVRNWCPRAISSLPQLVEVVDLAVEDDPDRAVLVRHRLDRCLEVDDRESSVSEAGMAVEVQTAGVGPAADEPCCSWPRPRAAVDPARRIHDKPFR